MRNEVRNNRKYTETPVLIKWWLAQLWSEWLDEMQDLELTIDRAMEQYLRFEYSENWINQRLKSIEVRRELTDEWKRRGVKEGGQFVALTDVLTQAWADRTTREYKELKGLKKVNLWDNMINIALILTILAEASAKDISQSVELETFDENVEVAFEWGTVARIAREELEARTGRKVVTSRNAKDIRKELN